MVDQHLKADLRWFTTYLDKYNGRSIIEDSKPSMDIYADVCPEGFGANTEGRAYGVRITQAMTQSHSISELECFNFLVAARTFLSEKHTGRPIRINCDNEPTVYAYSGGKARNKVLAACACAMWMLSASLHIAIVFRHIQGVNMVLADALSRAHKDKSYQKVIDDSIRTEGMALCIPRKSAYNYAMFL